MLDLLEPLELFSEETPVETTLRFGATGGRVCKCVFE